MQLGVSEFPHTNPIENYPTIIEAGFDFVEIGLGKAAQMSEEDFDQAARGIEASQTQVVSCNWFLPPELKVTGPEVSDQASQDFLDLALPRAARLGAKAIVFGSPASRSVPDGFSHEEARDQMKAFCTRVADSIAAKQLDIRLAIEHVNYTETNFVRTLADAIHLAREIERPEIGVAIDFYHLEMEKESLEVILDAEGLACAVQLADPSNRSFPQEGSEIPRLEDFFSKLRAINYDAGVSVEATPGEDLLATCRSAAKALRPFLS